MEVYGNFAEVYDVFMEDIDYDGWVCYVEEKCDKYNLKPKDILDLGCGTGSVSVRLAKKGYGVIGVDVSEEMLMVARDKAKTADVEVLFLNQDMREFELYGTVECVVCLCDCLNYILDSKELEAVFSLVNNYLCPGGVFIFDMNTVHKYKDILNDNVFAQSMDESAYIWENYFDEETYINEYAMNFFVEKHKGVYTRFQETHYQKAYETEEIKTMLTGAGLEVLEVDLETGINPKDLQCERAYFIARRKS